MGSLKRNALLIVLAAVAAFAGWQLLPVIVLLSSVVGAVIGIGLLVFKGRDHNVPLAFGPYLAIAGWIHFIVGMDLLGVFLAWLAPN